MKQVSGGVCAPKGFTAAGVHCGIRKNRAKRDLALIMSEEPCAAAAVYTKNLGNYDLQIGIDKIYAFPRARTPAKIHGLQHR